MRYSGLKKGVDQVAIFFSASGLTPSPLPVKCAVLFAEMAMWLYEAKFCETNTVRTFITGVPRGLLCDFCG